MKDNKPSIEYWNVVVHKPPLNGFNNISRVPCIIVQDDEEFITQTTTPQEATFWSVRITDKSGETFTIADCKEEATAIDFQNWILYILKLLTGQRFL
ncbi:hypothetical protein [Paraflavitalea sp. CAU 1676]|uniref:hypothetical protein n=1 Tax=Paraflavitalea sp. CAU 1676 TaxID=3032598 RepID=UPI0023DA16F4|nr:hypothetical protein [Paraflavitalea sp. CAU 1676]MDF2190499.1 hypothetical protein [Paraflavitalea sp. CAU 1676]